MTLAEKREVLAGLEIDAKALTDETEALAKETDFATRSRLILRAVDIATKAYKVRATRCEDSIE